MWLDKVACQRLMIVKSMFAKGFSQTDYVAEHLQSDELSLRFFIEFFFDDLDYRMLKQAFENRFVSIRSFQII